MYVRRTISRGLLANCNLGSGICASCTRDKIEVDNSYAAAIVLDSPRPSAVLADIELVGKFNRHLIL